MSAAAPDAPGRHLVRLGLVLLLAVVWLLPWADVQGAGTGGLIVHDGAARTGLPALGALVLLWCLSLGIALAPRPVALRAAEAFASAALACALTGLLALEHPALPMGGRAQAWLPVFGPLAALALLEGFTRLRQAGGERAIGAVRSAAAAFAAATLLVAGAHAAAAAAAWIALAPLAFAGARDAHAARRATEVLVLSAALVAGFAPTLAQRIVLLPTPVGGITVAAVAWSVLAALVVLISTAGALAPREPA